ncbi:MAG: dihydroorotase [Bacillota bacterium]|nr:dihydroorotase [Bacillota bacterium]
MEHLLIRGGLVIDPSQDLEDVLDVRIRGGRVAELGRDLDPGGAQVVDAAGLWVTPGLVDAHVHLRVPGETHKEDLASGGAAAAAGGFTTVVCMPNTRPPLDDVIRVEWLRWKAQEQSPVRVHVAAALSRGLEGTELTAFAELKAAGAVAVTDDGRPVADAGLMRRALVEAAAVDLPVLVHAEEPALSGGAMHEGAVSAAAGMPGIPAAAEAVMVARDLLLAEALGARVHILHVSARQTVDLIRWAKDRGIRVTAEVTPHHLLLTDEDVAASGFDGDWKMNPPLRSEDDRQALMEALADGTVDIIATDHAPHHRDDKDLPFPEAAFGVVGLETAVAVVLDAMVPGVLSPRRFVEALSTGPAQVLGLEAGSLRPGMPADVTLIDPNREWIIDPARFRSRSRNTPFAGRRVRGRVVRTLVGGRTVFCLEDGPAAPRAAERLARAAAAGRAGR